MDSTAPGGASGLVRVADWCYRKRRRTVVLWVGGLVAAIALSGVLGGEFRADFTAPHSDSSAAFDLLKQRFPAAAGDTIDVVYRADAGTNDPAVQQRIAALQAELSGARIVADVDVVPTPPRDPQIGSLVVQLVNTGKRGDFDREGVLAVVDIVEKANAPGFEVEAGGPAVAQTEGGDFGSGAIGFVAAIFILLVAFGSLLAMGLPILTAVLGLGIAAGLTMLLARVLQVPDFAPQMADMIGIGVGIDYSLFILTRYRQGLRDGLDPRDATLRAVDTAGRAVLFAGATVVIAIMGLCVMGLGFLYGLAFSVSLTVLVMVAAALTLLPAVLGFVGYGIDKLHVPFVKRDQGSTQDNLAHRWSRVVQRYPWPAALAAFAVLLALTVPAFGLRFGFPDAGNGSPDLMSRKAFDLQTRAYGKGSNGRLILAVDTKSPAGINALAKAGRAAAADSDVDFVSPPIVSPTGNAAISFVVPKSGPQEDATADLVHRIRNGAVAEATAGTDANIHVGGITAAFVDQNRYLLRRLPWFIGAVVVLSFLLLMVVFRSLLVPLKAAIMNLLSIGAAYGVVALSTNGGPVGDLIGIHEKTPVPGFIPMMMFATLFGLSMDYEVFLLSSVREEYVRTGDNASAVAEGLARTARVITAAAAIMVAVFSAFILGDMVFIKMVGLGMATAIFVDATIVRMVLVPATMELLGDRNWWYPAWLDRRTPRISVEGHLGDLDAELRGLVEPERV